jgi:hypothetical protein
VLPSLRWRAFVLFGNVVAAALVLHSSRPVPFVLTYTVTAATINVGVAALVWQQYFVSVLFGMATSVPLGWPCASDRPRAASQPVRADPPLRGLAARGALRRADGADRGALR